MPVGTPQGSAGGELNKIRENRARRAPLRRTFGSRLTSGSQNISVFYCTRTPLTPQQKQQCPCCANFQTQVICADRMVWDKAEILQTLKKLHKQGDDLSYNALTRRMQSLISASAYHFGSYRRAVEQAGIDYAAISRRPRWSKTAIIKLIKEGKRSGEDLHWSAITKRQDDMGRAAFASLQPRLFGSWDRALHAAGLDADDINRYRKWTRDTIVTELKARHREGEPLNSGAIQREDPSLHAAAVRHFAGYDHALQAAKLDPAKVRQRKIWEKSDVVKGLKLAKKTGKHVSDSAIRRDHPALYGAAVRLFGSFTAARSAAGIKLR